MALNVYNKNKFNLAEIFNNTDGKTSGSGFIGVVSGSVASLCFLIATIGYLFKLTWTIDVMSQCVFMLGISAALLGVRKFTGKSKGNEMNFSNEKETKETEVEQLNS